MRRLAGLARRAGRRLLRLAPRRPALRTPKAVRLTVVAEAGVLSRVPHPLDGGLTCGGVVGALLPGDEAARVRDVWYAPAFGAVFDRKGRVFKSAVSAALHLTPNLAALPRARREGAATMFPPPEDAPTLARATVFVSWAGLHNYAHFLIDCLPALHAVQVAGALERFPAIAPPLLPWQRQLLSLLLGEDAPAPVEVAAPLAQLGEAVFALSMDPSREASGASLSAVRARVLANAAITEDPAAPRNIYVSRLGSPRRVMVNEAELETALAARGFAIVRPEILSVRELIALFHRAETIVGSAGEAMANTLFCESGTRVIEIQPSNFASGWTRDVAGRAGVAWRGFPAPAPLARTEIMLAGELRPASEFSWSLDLARFLEFLDARPEPR